MSQQRFITVPTVWDDKPATASGFAIVRNGLALHRSVGHPDPIVMSGGRCVAVQSFSGSRWAITHIATGRYVALRESGAAARSLFRFLARLDVFTRFTTDAEFIALPKADHKLIKQAVMS